jgi:hypothetical protein
MPLSAALVSLVLLMSVMLLRFKNNDGDGKSGYGNNDLSGLRARD